MLGPLPLTAARSRIEAIRLFLEAGGVSLRFDTFDGRDMLQEELVLANASLLAIQGGAGRRCLVRLARDAIISLSPLFMDEPTLVRVVTTDLESCVRVEVLQTSGDLFDEHFALIRIVSVYDNGQPAHVIELCSHDARKLLEELTEACNYAAMIDERKRT